LDKLKSLKARKKTVGVPTERVQRKKFVLIEKETRFLGVVLAEGAVRFVKGLFVGRRELRMVWKDHSGKGFVAGAVAVVVLVGVVVAVVQTEWVSQSVAVD